MNESFNNAKREANGAQPDAEAVVMTPTRRNGAKEAEMNNNAQTAPDATQKKKSRSIGHYIIGKNIGEGTFGKVKLGTHILTNEKVRNTKFKYHFQVAVKILEKKKIVEEADVQRVSREIEILKMIRHPNIIQLFEIIETPKQLFLIMEYVSGGELFDYIVKKGKLSEKEACKYF